MIIEKLDHVSLGTERLTSFFDDAENLKALLSVILLQMDELEDVIIKLSQQKDINTVEGVWLDYLGLIIGLPRAGREDEEYRQALLLKTLVNRSDGTPPIISEIVKTFTESDRVRIAQGILSSGQVIFDGKKNASKLLWDLVQDIKPVTTNAKILENTNGNCVFPSWQLPKRVPEQILLLDDGTALELVLDDAGAVDGLFLSMTGEVVQQEQSLIGQGNIFEWEDPEDFTFSDGENIELILDDAGNTGILFAEGIERAKQDLTPLPWEITKDSFFDVNNIIEDFQWVGDGGVFGLFVNLDDFSSEKFEVRGVTK